MVFSLRKLKIEVASILQTSQNRPLIYEDHGQSVELVQNTPKEINLQFIKKQVEAKV